MLVIRKEQIESLQINANRRLAIRIRDWIQEEFSASDQTDEELEIEIETLIRKAQNYGIFDSDDIATFVEFDLLVLPYFDQDPRYNQILIDEQRSSKNKMEQLRAKFDQDFD